MKIYSYARSIDPALKEQIVMRLKLVLFLMIAGLMHVRATAVAQKISINHEQGSLKNIITELGKQSGYDFFYDSKTLEDAKPISVQLRNVSLEEALDACFENQALDYVIEGKSVVIKKKEKNAAARSSTLFMLQINIKGKVVGVNGEPLEGASVQVKGSNLAARTNANGEFTINTISAEAVLFISYVGYQSREISASSDLSIIALDIANDELQSVEITVNTGYQSISKERSAGAFAKPNMDVMQKRSGSMDVLQRLDGLVPGLTLNKGTNSEYFPVIFRGLTSINGTSQPLYVVDGVPVESFDQINPNDVADITILKDATAASIWGARAANGVIVVTTKKGTSEKLMINYDVFYSFQGKPDIDVFPRLSSKEYIDVVQELYDMPGYLEAGAEWPVINAPNVTSGKNHVLPHEYLLYNQPRWIPEYYKGKSLQDLAAFDNIQQMKDVWYRDAMLANHTLSMSGKAGKYGIYASLAYTDNQRSTPNDENKNYMLNVRQDFKISPRLDVYLASSLTYNTQSSPRAIAPDGRFIPYAPFLDNDGNGMNMSWIHWGDSLRNAYQQASIGLPDLQQLDLSFNPLKNKFSGYTRGVDFYTRLTGGATLTIAKGLKLEGMYAAIIENNRIRDYNDVSGFNSQYEIARMTVTGPPLNAYLPTTGGTFSNTNIAKRNWTIRHQLAYDADWEDQEHQLSLLAGTEFQQQTTSYLNTKVRGYDEYLLTYKSIDYNSTSAGLANTIINTAGTFKINDNFSETFMDTRFRSYYANIAYTWKHNYTINASTRFDQSNLFGKDVSAQAKPVWSVGGVWLASNERFTDNMSWLNRLAIRTTFGITGNSPTPGSGGSYDILAPSFAWGVPAGSVNALAISTPGNTRLSWEKTNNFNVGVDFALLGHRLSGNIDFYYKHTTNLLGDMPQNAFTGYPYVYGNAGVLKNKGLEITLNTINIRNENFKWVTQLNMAYNKGKVVTLFSATQLDDARSLIRPLTPPFYTPTRIGLMEGYQPFTLFAYRYAGLDAMGDPQIYLADGTITKEPGAAKVSDLVDMGSTLPLYIGGVSNHLSYKGFHLGVNLVYNLGFVLRRDVNEFYTGRIQATNFTTGGIHTDFISRWKKTGDENVTLIPAYDPSTSRASRTDLNYYTAADVNVFKGDYIKIRDITFSYDLPKMWTSKVHAELISIRFQMNNMMLWRANDHHIDPEFYNGMGLQVASGMSSSYVSGIRSVPNNQNSFTIGAHITF